MNKSIWIDTSDSVICKSLNKDLELDVLIIGGGITGINCLYQLRNSNLNVALLEANRVGSGITSRTTGKLTYLQGNYYKIYKKLGFEISKKYYESQRDAINIAKSIINDNYIECDLVENDSFLFTNNISKIDDLKKEKKLLEEFGCCDIFNCERLPDGQSFLYGFKGSGSYVYHPLKYLYGLKKILKKNIYENSRVISIEKEDNYYLCKTNDAVIRTKYVVLAVHYPSFLFPFMMPLKVTLEKSYVSALRTRNYNFNALGDKNNTCISIRYHKEGDINYKINLYGSRNIAFDTNDKKHFDRLKDYIGNYNYLWSNIDVVTGDYLPYIGLIKENMFLATGYNTWGMTNGILAGKIIKNLILNKKDKYSELFNPRRISGGCFFKAMLSSGKSYLEEVFYSNKGWYDKNISFEKKGNDDVAVYIDEVGCEHVVYNKCPHMKCGLIFNEVEKTWDCPCHGSRFNIDGHVIDGPSNMDISYKEKDS